MNKIVKINNTDLSVKEFNGQRVVTFKDIDMLHERVEGTADRNFRENKLNSDGSQRFIEGEDYFVLRKSQNNEIRGLEIPNRGITLVTESGYLMLVKSLQDDLAWKVQRELVNNYFRVKEVVQALNTSELSPELQMFNQMFKAMANNELETKEAKRIALNADSKAEEVKEEIQSMRDAITLDSNGWRKETTKIINRIAQKLGGFAEINILKKEIYQLLNDRLGVDVNRRLLEKKKRMALEGVSKSKIEKTNILDVISEDKKLIDGYLNIVRQYALKYGV